MNAQLRWGAKSAGFSRNPRKDARLLNEKKANQEWLSFSNWWRRGESNCSPQVYISATLGVKNPEYLRDDSPEYAWVFPRSSDVYGVLAFIAFASPAITRTERVASHKGAIFSKYDYKQQEFIDFVLAHYESEGVAELGLDKLTSLIELKYHNTTEAVAELGAPAKIREVFVGFQRYLYHES